MALILEALIQILQKPSLLEIAIEMFIFAAPLWIALIAGLVIGWAWRPRWVVEVGEKVGVAAAPQLSLPSCITAFIGADKSLPSRITTFIGADRQEPAAAEAAAEIESDSAAPVETGKLAVGSEDLDYLCRIVEERDGGKPWIHMMDRSLPGMVYQAWRRDPENHPPQYRSRTVYEDVTPELVRDFFWDDEFRIKNGWDDMLLYHETLEECPTTGTMIVHWVRKFPFFCSDREYTIGRRIWDLGRAYYCVTKGVPYLSLPRRNKPRRVDLYYSSWCIRAVESSRGDGQMTACEVLLFHHEDMGIPWEIAKLGIRQGMWACVKKIEPGLRAYQLARRSGEPLSRCALMAQITTKIDVDYLRSVETSTETSNAIEVEEQKPWGLFKFALVGGAVVLACTLDHGLVTKAVIFGVARRFGKFGRRL